MIDAALISDTAIYDGNHRAPYVTQYQPPVGLILQSDGLMVQLGSARNYRTSRDLSYIMVGYGLRFNKDFTISASTGRAYGVSGAEIYSVPINKLAISFAVTDKLGVSLSAYGHSSYSLMLTRRITWR